ncbi:MAG: methyl-accepting chemotaxis protein [Pirellulales bacterium]
MPLASLESYRPAPTSASKGTHPDSSRPSTTNPRSTKSQCSNHPQGDVTVKGIVEELALAVQDAVHEIHHVNSNARVLALNARIEAARAGEAGAAFGVVASEMQSLSQTITEVANTMSEVTNSTVERLLDLLIHNVLGSRLADIARTNIDLVDRNLYERTCDVRWWATDRSITDALEQKSQASLHYASERMRVILGAYTVYFDLVLCDEQGNIVANGRPDLFSTVGKNCSNCEWFQKAMRSRSGDEFSFEAESSSSLVGNQPALIYSCGVRSTASDVTSKGLGDSPIGVLGVVFHWHGLALPILQTLANNCANRRQRLAYSWMSKGIALASSREGDAANGCSHRT